MEIVKETQVEGGMVDLEMDCTKEEINMLLSYAKVMKENQGMQINLENITEDEIKELFNYAVNDILKKAVDGDLKNKCAGICDKEESCKCNKGEDCCSNTV